MDKILGYLAYLLIGFSLYTFCAEIEEFEQEIGTVSLVLAMDFVVNAVCAAKGYLYRRYWVGLGWIFVGFNGIMVSLEYTSGVIFVGRRVLNSVLFANFGALAPYYVLGLGSQTTSVAISALQASLISGFLLALILNSTFTISLSIMYLISSVFYLVLAFKFEKLGENPGIQGAKPVLLLSHCKHPVIDI